MTNQAAIKYFDQKFQKLENTVQSAMPSGTESGREKPNQIGCEVAFLSLCDGEHTAHVFHESGNSIPEALQAVGNSAQEYINRTSVFAQWVKVDIVTCAKTISRKELGTYLKGLHEYCRMGVSLDPDFHDAYLEAEVNANMFWDYSKKRLSRAFINRYLRIQGREAIQKVPDKIIGFSTKGWICDDSEQVIELSDYGLTYGRRKVEVVDDEYAYGLVAAGASYLGRQMTDDCSFHYGYRCRRDRYMKGYNNVRHSGTVWSLIRSYALTGDESLLSPITKGLQFIVENALVYRDENTAYIIESTKNEIRLGGLGLTLIALCDYMKVFKTDRYLDVAKAIGNAILSMRVEDTYQYIHVLNLDYTIKKVNNCVFYDGESTFGLCLLYELCKDEKYIIAAKHAADYFIAGNYEQYRDHWIAYSFNELTRYYPEPEYLDFALRNAQLNLDYLFHRQTINPTGFELLMASFEVYDRIVRDHLESPYLKKLDVDLYFRTIYCRADRMLNSFFYPEYAMYMANPAKIYGTFFCRADGFRIRIDDVQHTIGGYYMYVTLYDRLIHDYLAYRIKNDTELDRISGNEVYLPRNGKKETEVAIRQMNKEQCQCFDENDEFDIEALDESTGEPDCVSIEDLID